MRKRLHPVLVALLISIVLAGGRLIAVPPLISDDVPTADKQGFEFYFGYQYLNDEGDARRSLLTELVYGVTDQWEISIAPSYLSENRVDGFGDVGIGTKYNFLKEHDKLPGLALSIGLSLPTARRSSGLGTGAFDSNFVLCAQKTWGRFTAYSNVGYAILPDSTIGGIPVARRNSVFLSFAASWQAASKTKLFAETVLQTADEAGEPNTVVIDIGLEQSLRENFKLQATLGKGLRGGGGGGPGAIIYIGFEWDFDAPWKRAGKEK